MSHELIALADRYCTTRDEDGWHVFGPESLAKFAAALSKPHASAQEAPNRGPCTVCGVPASKHGSYPTCATHAYRAPHAPAPVQALQEKTTINGEPATAHSLLAALIDIYDDAQSCAPEDRCYVESAWPDVLKEARTFLAAPVQAETLTDTEVTAIHKLPFVRSCLLEYHHRPVDETAAAVVKAIAAQVLAAAGAECPHCGKPLINCKCWGEVRRYQWLRENGAELFYAIADLAGDALDAAIDDAMGDDPAAPVRAAPTEHEIIAGFLERTGQYVTNDASREAAVKHAVTDTDLQYREAMHCLSDVMRAANHALVGMPPSETEAKLRAELFRAHVWFMAEVNSDTYMGEPANQPKENDSADDFVNGCPHCGGTGGHWEGCRAPVQAAPTEPTTAKQTEACAVLARLGYAWDSDDEGWTRLDSHAGQADPTEPKEQTALHEAWCPAANRRCICDAAPSHPPRWSPS